MYYSGREQRRIDELEECLQKLISASYNIDVPEGGIIGYGHLMNTVDKVEFILRKGVE